MSLPADLSGPVGEITSAYNEALTELADVRSQLEAANAKIAQLETQPAPQPTTSKPLLGLAVAGGHQTAWDAAVKALGVTPRLFHAYHGTGSIPASFTSSPEGSIHGPTVYLVNLKPVAGQGAALTAYCNSLPAGSRVILHHEPENDGITPQQYADEWERDAKIVRATGVKVGCCFMSSTVRTKGRNTYLDALTSRPDFVAYDGYAHTSSGYKSAHTLFDTSRAYSDAKWPGVEQVIAEWGADGTGTNRANWITAAGAYFTQAGYTVAAYFDNPKGATGNYLIDTDPVAAKALAGLA